MVGAFRLHGEGRATNVADDALCCAPEQKVAEVGMAARAEGHEVRAALSAEVDDAHTMALAVLEVELYVQLAPGAKGGARPLLETSSKGVTVLLLELRRHVGSRSAIVQAVPWGSEDVEHVQRGSVARGNTSGL